jgi:hypothetical protein
MAIQPRSEISKKEKDGKNGDKGGNGSNRIVVAYGEV